MAIKWPQWRQMANRRQSLAIHLAHILIHIFRHFPCKLCIPAIIIIKMDSKLANERWKIENE
jgi:hypothetical protein